MFDLSTIRYDCEMTVETGETHLLNGALVGLTWESQQGEFAQRATITLANFAINGTFLHMMCKPGCLIRIYSDWGQGRTLVFDGVIWEWQYASASAQKIITLLAYDPLIRLQQSEDFEYFTGGMDTKDIIAAICTKWGIPLSYAWTQSITHEKLVFNGDYIGDMILQVLDEVVKKTDVKYVIGFSDGQLKIFGYGENADVYLLTGDLVENTLDRILLNNVVTRVLIYGKEDGEGRRKVEHPQDGDTSFGVLQRIIITDDVASLDDAKKEADTILKEQGKPEEFSQLTCPDIPFMKKGDRLNVSAGSLLGSFYIEGVSHTATDRKMTLTLSRITE